MGWSVGYDPKWKRDIGYGVPGMCDEPGCEREIDRGLSYVCGNEPYGGDFGCGLFFCDEHLYFMPEDDQGDMLCGQCKGGQAPHQPTPDTAEWKAHKLNDASWARWRKENPAEAFALAAQ